LMPRILWPLRRDRPSVQISLYIAATGKEIIRHLLADTGAGTAYAGFELMLQESDCHQSGGIPAQPVTLGGAYVGSYPVYAVRVQIQALGFDQHLRVVGVPTVPPGLDGLAGFRFLNRFSYGNFGDPSKFGLEM
jgi:hypothetical protein